MASVCVTTTVYFDADEEAFEAQKFEEEHSDWSKEVNTIWIKFTKHSTTTFKVESDEVP